jgi:hypothetical protein
MPVNGDISMSGGTPSLKRGDEYYFANHPSEVTHTSLVPRECGFLPLPIVCRFKQAGSFLEGKQSPYVAYERLRGRILIHGIPRPAGT